MKCGIHACREHSAKQSFAARFIEPAEFARCARIRTRTAIEARRTATTEKFEAIALTAVFVAAIATCVFTCEAIAAMKSSSVPADYKGKPYGDARHKSKAQAIPGRLQAALFDLGGEGVAYHDTDAINHGSGELNHKPEHCENGVPVSTCRFRENEGMDISYVKKGADLNHPNLVTPDWQQLYIGWTEDGEWVNYTVNVKQAGTYHISTLYTHLAQPIEFSLNGKPAAVCTLPVDPATQIDMTKLPDWVVWHVWNNFDCGTIVFPKRGLNLLTLHLKHGNNFAYFDFTPDSKNWHPAVVVTSAPARPRNQIRRDTV